MKKMQKALRTGKSYVNRKCMYIYIYMHILYPHVYVITVPDLQMMQFKAHQMKLEVEYRGELVLPVKTISDWVVMGKYARSSTDASGVFVTGFLEYILTEIIEISGSVAYKNESNIIRWNHMKTAIEGDDEMNSFFGEIIDPFVNQLHFTK